MLKACKQNTLNYGFIFNALHYIINLAMPYVKKLIKY